MALFTNDIKIPSIKIVNSFCAARYLTVVTRSALNNIKYTSKYFPAKTIVNKINVLTIMKKRNTFAYCALTSGL